ncbi:hypothetical protein DB30_00844 [Enhygromyxa salina]|uniref:Lipoprotein n=1 Tax=Enhygromyxa salina TaxID=215803 RepID=A0A0C2CTL4_9BACT|nr:hypothetical protein [Enhygromyxa salina]KIG12960.1 hypothetical protein DB30_00844 [Enhygromyxa salina]
MRKITTLTSLCLALTFSLVACDKKEEKADDKKADAKTDDKKTDDKAVEAPAEEPPPAEPPAAAVEVSEDMKNFMAKFDGTDPAVTAALKEFGANEEIHDDDMGMYTLKDPKVVAAEGDCFTMEAGAGMTIRTYNVCWAEGKINKIEDKGMR